MEAMEAQLQTTLRVTGRTARNNNPGHLLNLALENITAPRHALLPLALVLCLCVRFKIDTWLKFANGEKREKPLHAVAAGG